MRDLNSHRSMKLKAALFAGIGLVSGCLLWISIPTFKSLVLLVLCIWAFCRLYYFAFYVIERYIDPGFRFSVRNPVLIFSPLPAPINRL